MVEIKFKIDISKKIILYPSRLTNWKGQLEFLDFVKEGFYHYDDLGIDIMFVDGHTEKQMIPKIKYKGKTLVFAADLIPTAGHIPIPYLMGYDVRPLITMEEKKHFLDLAVKKDYLVFLEHDAHNQVVSLKNTEKGVRLNNSFNFNEI